MNKYILTLLVVIGLLLILFISTIVLEKQEKLFVRSPLLFMERPVVTYILGEAEGLRNSQQNDTGWEALAIGDKLIEGTVVRTGDDSTLDIRFSDRTAVRLAENTFIRLDEISVRNLILGIEKGTLFSRFERIFKDQDFRVVMPTAVAGIRGTELIFTVEEGRAVITALSGITEIYNPALQDQRVLLAFQRRTTVEKDTGPTEPEEITQKESTTLQQTLNSIHLEKVLLVTSTIQFAPNADIILEESLPELDLVAKQLADKEYSVRIDGHTAKVGSTESMYRLSVARAERIRQYLIEQGINSKRLTVAGYGGTKPITENETPEGRAENRRVEFVIID